MGQLRFGEFADLELKADDSTMACRGWGRRTCRCGFGFGFGFGCGYWLAHLGIGYCCAGVAKKWNSGPKEGLGEAEPFVVVVVVEEKEMRVLRGGIEDDWERGVWRVVGLGEVEAKRASLPWNRTSPAQFRRQVDDDNQRLGNL